MTATSHTPLPNHQWVRLLTANNPGVMTGNGTNTWLLGDPTQGILVVDPGPNLPHHTAALRAALANTPAVAVLVTHHHLDHTGALPQFLHDHPDATSYAIDPTFTRGATAWPPGLGAGPYQHMPVPGITLTAVPTPGHTADSVSALVTGPDGQQALVSGDTVLGQGSSVIAHPDGCVGHYLVSLGRLLHTVDTATTSTPIPLLPGHGPAHHDARPIITDYLTHRVRRLADVAAANHAETSDAATTSTGSGDVTETNPPTPPAATKRAKRLAAQVYPEIDPALTQAVEASITAHLTYLDRHTTHHRR